MFYRAFEKSGIKKMRTCIPLGTRLPHTFWSEASICAIFRLYLATAVLKQSRFIPTLLLKVSTISYPLGRDEHLNNGSLTTKLVESLYVIKIG